MKRFWISWYSKLEPDDIPFKCWITGETMSEPPAYTYVADMEAASEEDAFDKVFQVFSDYTYRFCDEIAPDWKPSDRFR